MISYEKFTVYVPRRQIDLRINYFMDILISSAGMVIKEKWGDYDESSMDEESGMQIYVCKKA